MTKNKETKNHHEPYIILGLGLSGMITALAFAHYQIPVIIVESRSVGTEGFFDDVRTTALTAFSRGFLQKIGIWEEINDLCGPIHDIYVVDNKAQDMIHFTNDTQPLEDVKETPLMGYLIQNTAFKKYLYNLVKVNKFITIIDDVKYDPQSIINNENSCELRLNNNTILTSKLLIICDGRNSRAKDRFFSNETEEDYKQKALTFIVKHEKNHEGTAVEHFLSSGPFAILPLRNSHESSVVWSLPQEYAEVITGLSISELTYMVQENFGPFLGKIEIVSKIAAFPLRSHAARRYYNRSLVLVADSAHTIHPLAGQGLNQGIKDIDCLTSLIAGNCAQPADILAEYQRLRKQDNKNMLLITSGLNKIFSLNTFFCKKGRQLGFKMIERISPLKQWIVQYAMGKR